MGNFVSSSSSSVSSPPSMFCGRREQLKKCFMKTMEHQLSRHLPKLRRMSHAEMTKHFERVLQKSCLEPNGIDASKDTWAKTALQLTSCAISQTIVDGCVNAECSQKSSLKCLKRELSKPKREKTRSTARPAMMTTRSARSTSRPMFTPSPLPRDLRSARKASRKARKTPRKAPQKTPRKTPRKTSQKTPPNPVRKTSRKTVLKTPPKPARKTPQRPSRSWF